jgi:SAM-dependent methyltransferase
VGTDDGPEGNSSRARAAYDAVAEEYAARFRHELDHKPLDRALLRVLAEGTAAGSPIADVGCGPGHVAGWLAGQTGARTLGIDLSSRMAAIGRAAHPAVPFCAGDLRHLPVRSGALGAAAAMYSLIHLLPEELPGALVELGRALRPGGLLLVAFHAGSEVVHRDEWFGHAVSIDFRLLDPEQMVSALEGAGFTVEARLERRAYPEENPTTRVYLLARATHPAGATGEDGWPGRTPSWPASSAKPASGPGGTARREDAADRPAVASSSTAGSPPSPPSSWPMPRNGW